MKFKNLIVSQEENIIYITIDRPEKLNALNSETIQELHDSIKWSDQIIEAKTIIITGSGEKAFVAGADISEFANFDEKEGAKLARHGQAILFNLIENLGTPVIAAINGFALGGGLELAMACHIRIASDNAKMGLPEVSLGVIPGYGGTQRLPQLVGKGKAMEMIATAAMITADNALQWGLVNHVVSQEELIPLAEKIAHKIANNSPLAIKAAFKAINANYQDGINGFDMEIEQFGNSFGTDEFEEGTTAFLEKRKANF